jgi:hypothetical protein
VPGNIHVGLIALQTEKPFGDAGFREGKEYGAQTDLARIAKSDEILTLPIRIGTSLLAHSRRSGLLSGRSESRGGVGPSSLSCAMPSGEIDTTRAEGESG